MAIDGIYEGRTGIRRFFADMRDSVPDLQFATERLEPVGTDQVLASLRATANARTSSVAFDFDLTTVYDLSGAKITLIQVFLERADALEALDPRQ